MNTFAPTFTLRRFNNGLTVLIIFLALYVMLLPILPAWGWWIRHEAPLISTSPSASVNVPSAESAPQVNTLLIPDLALELPVHEGATARTLSQGAWHIPRTSSPDKGGNTVIAAHRHTKAGAGVFYNLDKLDRGDVIYMYWGKQRYEYTVSSIRVVPPTEVSVQGPTTEDVLTLYTCTPLWSFKDRLVVRADLKEAS